MPALYLATGKTAGEETSSTYEGRHVTLEESLLTHPSHTDGFVDKGDPVIFGGANGYGVGVAFLSAAAATDYISIDTEGIWFLNVVASDDSGVSAVDEGDVIYINLTTCILSKIKNMATQRVFGYALGDLTGSAVAAVCAVKVHWDPSTWDGQVNYVTTTSGSFGNSIYATLAGGASEGLTSYYEGHVTAALTGHTYNCGSWINVDGASLLAAGFICTPFEGGIYSGTTQPAARVVFAGQHQAILFDAPASLHAWRLNSTQTITALIAAANPGSVGYAAGAATTSTKCGDIPLADIVGPGIVYVRCYDAAG